jgi:hypothetical protein
MPGSAFASQHGLVTVFFHYGGGISSLPAVASTYDKVIHQIPGAVPPRAAIRTEMAGGLAERAPQSVFTLGVPAKLVCMPSFERSRFYKQTLFRAPTRKRFCLWDLIAERATPQIRNVRK